MRFLLAFIMSGIATNAFAETVVVKYIGSVDLTPFVCDDIQRSAFIKRVCFDGLAHHMVVLLGHTYYQHCGIDKATVDAFEAAPSMGAYYNGQIRGHGGPGPFDCRTKG